MLQMLITIAKMLLLLSFVYKLNTPQSNRVNRSQYGRGTSFRQPFVEYIANNCYIPISGMCFIKCNKYFTNKDYTEEFRDFIENEKHSIGVMTSARIQPFS